MVGSQLLRSVRNQRTLMRAGSFNQRHETRKVTFALSVWVTFDIEFNVLILIPREKFREIVEKKKKIRKALLDVLN